VTSVDASARPFDGPGGVRAARAHAVERTAVLGRPDLGSDLAIVVSELVTNALLHGGGCTGLEVEPTARGVRVGVHDRSRSLPLLGHASDRAMTGRGFALVGRLAQEWGVESTDDGKVVWAEITGDPAEPTSVDDLLALWDDDVELAEERYRVELGEVPTEFLLASKAHVDNLVREFTLIATGAAEGISAPPSAHLASLLEIITERFAEARLSIKRQALRAFHEGRPRAGLVLELTVEQAEAGEEYLGALDQLDDYCRALRLFTLETEPEHRVFRRWYVGEIIAQVQAAAAGRPAPPSRTFEEQLLDELRRVVSFERSADRAVRLSRLTRALAVAATPEAVADAVLSEGVAALRADAGGLLLAQAEDSRLALPGAIGYDERVLTLLRNESRNAALPAAVALRTGEPVWVETREERDHRFPEMAEVEHSMEAVCAVPLAVGDRVLGALRFSFRRPRVFGEEERDFVLTLADQTAQALDRAQLQHDRVDVSLRLQRSLLPPDLPVIPEVELTAVYHPYGAGVDVGGDFYDAWRLADDCWAIAVGDATGSGPEAAALTARVRHSMRALALSEREPEQLLHRLNTLMLEAAPGTERFCTALFGIVTVGSCTTVCLAGGGHPTPLVRRAGGSVERVPLAGSLLGILDDPVFESATVELSAGDSLVLVTDGVIEARSSDGAFFGEEGLRDVVARTHAPADELARTVEKAVLTHAGGSPRDDMAILVVRARD
jgi:serine phosphatase RsbU (regulator of sigma subunit)